MSEILNKTIVLVLNRNWQAINIRTPADAFCQMATNVATALEIDGANHIRPVTWDEWITLPIRPGDNAVQTVRGAIRVPTVIVALNFAKVPKKRPKLCAKTVRERDGNRCQYTGRLLRPDEGSLDHVLPRSRGGKDEWGNLVWSDKALTRKRATHRAARAEGVASHGAHSQRPRHRGPSNSLDEWIEGRRFAVCRGVGSCLSFRGAWRN